MNHLLSAQEISQAESKAESLPKLKCSASISFIRLRRGYAVESSRQADNRLI